VTTANPKARWFRPTPDRLVIWLLVVEGLLWLSERFEWVAKGWPALIAIAVVGMAMAVMGMWFAVAVILRWRFQFSIRSLLMLVVIVAVPCSWMATEMREARKQRNAVEEIW
jgi:hypothetical protein